MSQKNSKMDYLVNGIVKENPVLMLVIGLCPALAVSTSAINALGMGIAVLFVLTFSNFTISLIRKLIPNEVRIPIFIIVISTFVTVIDYFMHAYVPELYSNLGVFVPLIVVNCIILGRAEGFASKHNPFDALLDGLGSGFGFILAIFLIGAFREILGSGTFFGVPVFGQAFTKIPVLFFILPPGGYLIIALLMVFMNIYKNRREHAA
ncbi:electron transport complex subunit RsxE [candidate division TA06 bacterium]|uniref:Ion-translocating oxidoreductase complex subunit E n=1 Tax=candidate division TA06 bacterium TaxID=2250710 RepID=A0A660SQN9_UNCT6|nr:MAG: electron transport complex subunit RsxE [candidate division TA06 bacterium]